MRLILTILIILIIDLYKADGNFKQLNYLNNNKISLNLFVKVEGKLNCSDKPCQNGATCTSHLFGYKCECLKGFFGKNCEFGKPNVYNLTCQNGGIKSNSSQSCSCLPGFFGSRCQYRFYNYLSTNKAATYTTLSTSNIIQ